MTPEEIKDLRRLIQLEVELHDQLSHRPWSMPFTAEKRNDGEWDKYIERWGRDEDGRLLNEPKPPLL